MSLLEIFFLVSGLIILFLGVDIYRRKKFNALHVLFFIGIGVGLLVFAFFPGIVNILAKVVGVQRGADALVYGAIIFLLYFVLLLLRKADITHQDITFLVREIALDRVYISPTTPVHTGDILFLVRSYNESTRIAQTLQSIYDSGYGDILVVDDGSTDGTQDILARDFLGTYTYIRHAKNCGAGAALETGLEYIRRNISTKNWKYVCTFDADGQHDIADIPTFLAAFECDKKLDIVLGSRFIVPTQSNVPYIRRCILWGGKIFTSMISGVHLTDAHNGYRMMKVHTTRDIHISMDGMEYASEYIDQIRGMHIAEVPVNIHYDDYTMAKGQRYGGPVRIVARMIWKKFFS